jgi:hypothetical protein
MMDRWRVIEIGVSADRKTVQKSTATLDRARSILHLDRVEDSKCAPTGAAAGGVFFHFVATLINAELIKSSLP